MSTWRLERSATSDQSGDACESIADLSNGAGTEQLISCPICCDEDGSRFLRSVGTNYSLHHCRECDIRFSYPMRGGDRAYYQAMWAYSPEVVASRPKRLDTIAQVWEYQAVLDHVREVGGRLLDLGCGHGEFLYLARERYGFEVAGLDFNMKSVSLARALYGLHQTECSAWPTQGEPAYAGPFEVVTMLHILEHLEDPVISLREASRVLAPHGVLAVVVPALMRRPAFFNGDRDLPPHHLTLWSEKSLARALQAAGLVVKRVTRRPLQANDFLSHLQDRHAFLRSPFASKLVWSIGLKTLQAPVAAMRSLLPTAGSAIIGIAECVRPESLHAASLCQAREP